MKTAIVTGGNRGIGFEFCKQLKAQGYQVTALCRKPSAQLEELGVTIESGVDVTDASALSKLTKKFENASIDLLINNAGIFLDDAIGRMDFDSVIKQFQVNSLGPLLVTETFLSKIKPGGKIAMITSRMGSIADNTSGGYYGYRASKAALNAFSKSLSLDLKGKNISVAILHPGYVSTDMTSHKGEISPEFSAQSLLKVIHKVDINNSGTFWHCSGEVLPW